MRDQTVFMSLRDLRPAERRLVTVMRQLGYGRIECIRIDGGQLVLDPWPTVVRSIKFGSATPNQPDDKPDECALKKQIAEFLAQVRCVDDGVIRILEVRGGLPFSMEIADNLDVGRV
jgi:hypothetical protein